MLNVLKISSSFLSLHKEEILAQHKSNKELIPIKLEATVKLTKSSNNNLSIKFADHSSVTFFKSTDVSGFSISGGVCPLKCVKYSIIFSVVFSSTSVKGIEFSFG